MRTPVRVGVVGLSMGRYHVERYCLHPEAKVQAVCDTDLELARRTGADFGIPQVFSSFEEFLEKAEIDAVSIVVPNVYHKPMTLAALDRGWHVMCEKPMALNTAEALEMQARVKATGLKFMIHFNQRFRPEHLYFRKVIESGDLGRIYYASAGWRRMRNIPGLGGWFTQKAMSGGGPLIDLGVHMLDLTRWITGRPKVTTVSASISGFLGTKIGLEQGKLFDVEDFANALIRFDNGLTLHLEVSWALNFEAREKIFLELSGTEGGLSSLNYDYKDTHLYVFRDHGGVLTRTEPLKFPSSFENGQQHFVNCILHDRQPDASAEDGVEIMRILDAIYESAKLGHEVNVVH